MMRKITYVGLVIFFGMALVVGCSDDTNGGDGGVFDGDAGLPPECESDEDCKDEFCVGGQCVECRFRADCAEGEVCLVGDCVTDCPADDRCETGGTCCPGDWECLEGVCRAPCAGERCGAFGELCCGGDELCQENQCLLDCGNRERCGADMRTCCEAGQICYAAECVNSDQHCVMQSDCPTGYVCERDLGICIPEEIVGDCLYHPPEGEFTPLVECRWTADSGGLDPNRKDIVMAPVVANLTDDNSDGKTNTFDTPDIAFISYDRPGDGCCNQNGTLRIVSGRCRADGGMTTIFETNTPALDNSGGLAIGDLDGDGVPEIVGVLNNSGNPQGTVAFRRTAADGGAWEVMWTQSQYPTWNVHTRGGAQPALADMDADGHPEVIVGNVVLNGQNGNLVFDGVVTSGGAGGIGNNAFLGPVSCVADIDNDGFLELLAGNSVYEHTGDLKWTYTYTTENSECNGSLPCDGYNAVGNFDDDSFGEVVIVRQGEVFVIEHTGVLKARIPIPIDDCPYNESGPPTVADFDGDGFPEIGTAAADFYVVVDLDCLVEPLPAACLSSGVLWAVPNQDCSSRVTASSVFDFEGDGRAEVIYADEQTFRILKGSDGTELFRDASHQSHTRLEMAVIADVDNDGNTEVLIVSNRDNDGNGAPGLRVWGDQQDNWVFTRRIWNQHSYNVTNVTETGGIPTTPDQNWSHDHLNNFRQNTQGEGLFYAPDLVTINLTATCLPGGALHIAFDVMNQGSRMVSDGLPVSVYVDGTILDTVFTSKSLLPGQLEHFALSYQLEGELLTAPFPLRVEADDQGDGNGIHNECEDGGEDNNGRELASISCGFET
ncbi:MAG: VCBS repeat-containing protein [Deltaproteobacteria bacterium]|nr:VCBS repeat-containing protein [Deltaproteobacteria bacterium]